MRNFSITLIVIVTCNINSDSNSNNNNSNNDSNVMPIIIMIIKISKRQKITLNSQGISKLVWFSQVTVASRIGGQLVR